MTDPSAESARAKPPARRLLDHFEHYLHIEAASGIVLLLAAAVALIWANSSWAESYEKVWHAPLTLGIGPWISRESLHFWINDGLMAIFFLVVGLEIRRELHEGALSTRQAAVLPLVAALGGVAVPAAIYLAINAGDPMLRQGWAVPTATDIAFALGVLALLGRRVPSELRVLLLALAIIDDIVAIIVIALFYSSGITAVGLAVTGGGMVLTLLLQKCGVRSAWIYLVPGMVVWVGLLIAGIHPAIAGVLLGLLTPVANHPSSFKPQERARAALEEFRARRHRGERDVKELDRPLRQLRDAQVDLLPPVMRLQASLHPWVAFGIMPLFALANAGVSIAGLNTADASFAGVALGVGAGLLLGKPLGIALATFLGVKLGLCRLPDGIGRSEVLVLGFLGGIGFTMAIFISDLAFMTPELLATAKFAVLLASAGAAVLGFTYGRWTLRGGTDPRS